MKFYLHTFFICCILFIQHSFSQNSSIFGTIVDKENAPISYANVILLTQQDSTLVIGVSTNDEGAFRLNNLDNNNYILKISFIGYKENIRNISIKDDDIDLKQIILEESTESLNEINIIAKRPTFKKEADRMVFNIENTALADGTMLQVLKSTPGVLVLGDDIKVKNTIPTVYINDRKVNLSTADISQLFSGSSASAIKSVEVITNPSAKYDAESGVVLNIIMKKNLISGYRGSLFGNYTQGVFPRYNIGTNHFFKNKKISFNINYSFNKNKLNRDANDIINYLNNTNEIEETWTSIINRNTWSNTHNVNLNFDYFIDDKNTISLSSTGLIMPYFKYLINNNTSITDVNSNFLSRFTSNNTSNDDKYNLGFDLDYKHEFTKGQLSINTHYTTYNYERGQNVISNYYDVNDDFIDATAFNTNANQNTDIFTSKMDYSTPLSETSNLELGLKFSDVTNKSDIKQFNVDLNTGNEELDIQNTDAYNYFENILAAYSNYSFENEKWAISFGLRAEQTRLEGESISTSQTNTQDYFKWFPNASAQYNFSDNFNIYGNYKRNISRPGYADLNPFRFFLNDNYIIVGNPNLQPTFIDHYTAGTRLFNMFTFETYYKSLDGNIHEIPRQDNNTNIIEYTSVNVDKTLEFGFDFIVDFYLTKNWYTYILTSFYNIEEETDFGNGLINQSQWSNYSVWSNNISLLEDQSLDINLTLTWAGKNLQGFQIIEDRLISDLSISKSIFNKNGSLSLSIEDLFNMQDYDTSTRYQNQFSKSKRNLDNRTIKLGFRYNIGNTKLETNARTNELDELDRLNNSSN